MKSTYEERIEELQQSAQSSDDVASEVRYQLHTFMVHFHLRSVITDDLYDLYQLCTFC